MIKKTVIISGGLGGIGWAIFERMSSDGFLAAILAPHIPEKKFLEYEKAGHLFLKCDLTDDKSVEGAVVNTASKFGQITACIHCAVSSITRKKILDTSTKEFRDQFEVGLFGGFTFLREAAKIMKQQSFGQILAITSASIEPNAPTGTMPGYISSKFALRGLLREMSRELAPYNITVNAIAPGFVATNLNKDIPERMQEFLKEKNPFHKTVSPKEVAGLAAFLCSDDAASLTGLQIPVAYGETMTL